MRIFFTFLILISVTCKAQTLSYGKSTFDETGDFNSMIAPPLKIENISTTTVEVFVNRFYQNLPANWTNCFCYLTCHPPSLDTLRFFLVPGETADIGIGFSTNEIPGIGSVKLTVEVVGGTQKDTLVFSASTMLNNIRKNTIENSFSVYPNPTTSKVIFNNNRSETYSLSLTDITGKEIQRTELLSTNQFIFDLKELPAGSYFIRAYYTSGRTETQKIIKN